MEASTRQVALDRSDEPWIGTFRNMGSVTVFSDGAFEIRVSGADQLDDVTFAEIWSALRYGWAEPLSLARRGFTCVCASGVTRDESAGTCLLVVGDPGACSELIMELSALGWFILADRLTPMVWVGEELIAHPSEAPFLAPVTVAAKSSFRRSAVRRDGDAVEVDLPRVNRPLRVGALVYLRRHIPHTPEFKVVRGHERFADAASLVHGALFSGSFDDAEVSTDARAMEGIVRLAALPHSQLALRTDSMGVGVAELVRWWDRLLKGPEAASDDC